MNAMLPLAMFALVSSITPGPNNIMLTSSGIWFGFLRSIPHMLGVTCGMIVLLSICAAGIGGLVIAVPGIQFVLKVMGSGYLLYLAWKLRHMQFSQGARGDDRPMSFAAAVLFQFANPKAWIMAITGASAFLPVTEPVWLAIFQYCLVFSVVNLPCIGVWAGTGAFLRRYLSQPGWRTGFSVVMVALTIYSALAIWL